MRFTCAAPARVGKDCAHTIRKAPTVINGFVSPPGFRGDGFDWFPTFRRRLVSQPIVLCAAVRTRPAGRLRVRERAGPPAAGLDFVCGLAHPRDLAHAHACGRANPASPRLALPILESWGILALQMLTVATFACTMLVMIGRWAIIPTFLFFVVLGISSSGGAVAPPLLPPPLAIVSEWLPSGATVTAIREAVYFHGGQHVLPFAVLAVWAATWLGLMLVVSRRRGTSPDRSSSTANRPANVPHWPRSLPCD
jgi:hypothetical protein